MKLNLVPDLYHSEVFKYQVNGDGGFLESKFLLITETKKLLQQSLKVFLPPGSGFEYFSRSAELTDK